MTYKELHRRDHYLQMLKDHTIKGWPSNWSDILKIFRAYWTLRDKYGYMIDKVAMKDKRVMIPEELWQHTIEQFLMNHMDIEKIQLLPELVY